ncbi:tRNA synthetases class I (M)-domain-containing protein [Rhodocollybia butyracea]|uniref:Probable methionine--tRNA ligase, mitochondrial n=1 Tax=Rhodocollybia butyracea TaxID=206335 RepID=A0A9P5PZJ0_9AGAR|nr:tRNA synthetases class I (M)-domain-containing protein [Rhodocollybia butyracea]
MFLRSVLPKTLSHRWVSTSTKPWYITTPLFYPNAVPHIGHLYSLVTADLFARYNTLKTPSRPVHFVTGSDEHGFKIQKAALDKGLPPQEFCDTISQQFRRLAEEADVRSTRFVRTSEDKHYAAVEHIWRELDKKGLIYKGSYSGWYSITDECFYTEGQVAYIPEDGETPARTISKETGATVEYSNETNYMFRLSRFREALLEHYTSNPTSIHPQSHHAHLVTTLQAPLEDISISRPQSRLSWGIPVPGDPEHTVYVWFDALIGYLTGIGYPWSDLGTSQGWPVDLQVIGKDIVRFHAVYLPAVLLALNLPLQRRILAHAHWTSSQKKMSKSLGNTTDPFQAIEEFGIDSVRYYLVKVGGRFQDDVDWSHEQLAKHDKELQAVLGNLFMRITSPSITARMSGPIQTEPVGRFSLLMAATRGLPDLVSADMDRMEAANALEKIVDLLRLANKTVTDAAPWKSTPEVARSTHDVCIEALRVSGICLQPFIPLVAGKLLDFLGVSRTERTWSHSQRRSETTPSMLLSLPTNRLFPPKSA